MEKPVQVKKYGQYTWNLPLLDLARRQHCLCFHCDRMRPSEPDHCAVAEAFYKICVENGNAFIMTRCKHWVPKENPEFP